MMAMMGQIQGGAAGGAGGENAPPPPPPPPPAGDGIVKAEGDGTVDPNATVAAMGGVDLQALQNAAGVSSLCACGPGLLVACCCAGSGARVQLRGLGRACGRHAAALPQCSGSRSGRSQLAVVDMVDSPGLFMCAVVSVTCRLRGACAITRSQGP